MKLPSKVRSVLLTVVIITLSFSAGSAAMYCFIQNRMEYMSQGIFIDRNRDMDKFGIRTGKDYAADNPYNYVPVDWLVKEVESDVIKKMYQGPQDDDVLKILQLAESGQYTIYYFSNNITMWYSLAGVEGYCLVDKSSNRVKEWVVLTGFITSMS